MSAEAAVYELLTTDVGLISGWGIDAERVFSGQSLDSPLRGSPFLVLRWEEATEQANLVSVKEVLTVWAHQAKADSTDYLPLRSILSRVKTILCEAIQVPGYDGTLTQAKFTGYSANFDDPIFTTITKNAGFEIVTR